MVDKCGFSGLIDVSNLEKKMAMIATKAELNTEQDRIVKLQACDWSYFRGKSSFKDDNTQN